MGSVISHASGQVIVHTAGGQNCIEALVRQHTLDQTMEHLARSGMQMQAFPLAGGEVEILGREQYSGLSGEAAEIRAQIAPNGTAWVDIDRVQGNRCEEIIQGIAGAMGGMVAGMNKKSAYYQSVGFSSQPKVRL